VVLHMITEPGPRRNETVASSGAADLLDDYREPV
jgi:hypothetical protein